MPVVAAIAVIAFLAWGATTQPFVAPTKSEAPLPDEARMRNRGYHGPADTFDRLDYRRMSEVVKGVYSYIARR